MSSMLYHHSTSHPLTKFTISGHVINGETFVTGVRLGKPVVSKKCRNPDLIKYSMMIREYLDGKRRSLDCIPLDMSHCTSFQKKVLMTAGSTNWGSTISYSCLASDAGYPGAVRAAASVMRKNAWPLIIPCHRVIRKNGDIGGYSGKLSGREVDLKKAYRTGKLSGTGILRSPEFLNIQAPDLRYFLVPETGSENSLSPFALQAVTLYQ